MKIKTGKSSKAIILGEETRRWRGTAYNSEYPAAAKFSYLRNVTNNKRLAFFIDYEEFASETVRDFKTQAAFSRTGRMKYWRILIDASTATPLRSMKLTFL